MCQTGESKAPAWQPFHFHTHRAGTTAERATTSAVLAAEGEAQAAVLRADGAAKARVISAEAEATAVTKIYEGLRAANPQPNELAHRYLQALPEVAKGDANKVWIIPAELTGALERLKDGMSGPTP